MLFLYDKQKKVLQPCKETRFSDHGLLERQNIEQWVEQFPEILAEELLVITKEYDRFDKTAERVDLLALDKEGNLVVVELKRDDSGKNVDLQAIKYAAYCSTLSLQEIVEIYHKAQEGKGCSLSLEEAKDTILQFIESDDFEELNEKPRIILVAREFRPEVTASVLWLNKCGLDITCIKLSPYGLTDSGIAIESSILIPLPEVDNLLINRKTQVPGESARTVTQIEYINFFKNVVDLLKQKLPGEYAQPDGRSFYKIPTGMSGVHFEWAFHGRPRSSFGVELHFETANRDVNRSLIDQLSKFAGRIEAKLQLKPVFQREWGQKRKCWSRLYVEKPEGKISEELKLWAAEKMFDLIGLLQPELDRIRITEQ